MDLIWLMAYDADCLQTVVQWQDLCLLHFTGPYHRKEQQLAGYGCWKNSVYGPLWTPVCLNE